MRTLLYDGSTVSHLAEWMDLDTYITSFGVDHDGDLYLATIDGDLYRLIPVR